MTAEGAYGQNGHSVGVPLSGVRQGAAARARAVDEEERAALYNLLGSALEGPLTEAWLAGAAGLAPGDGPLGEAIGALAREASQTTAQSASREYHDLFIGVGRGELVPFASYYLTGFLHEKPLAQLRADMARLGVERDPSTREPEDHAAALCQMMGGFILGSFGEPLGLAEQKRFYAAHVGNWMPYFFRDLEKASSGRIYKVIGSVGRLFLEIEGRAFEMVD